MAQQISESELVLMKIIWKHGGAALYSVIMEALEKEKTSGKEVFKSQENRQAQ